MQQKLLISVFKIDYKQNKVKGRTFALPNIDSLSLVRSDIGYSVLASVSTGVISSVPWLCRFLVVAGVSSTVRSDVADGRRLGVLFRQRDRLPVPPVVD